MLNRGEKVMPSAPKDLVFSTYTIYQLRTAIATQIPGRLFGMYLQQRLTSEL